MLSRIGKKRESYRKKIGVPPGTLLYIGEHRDEEVLIERFKFNESEYRRFEEDRWSGKGDIESDEWVDWINVQGLSNVEDLEKIGREFKLHPLTMEDILNTTQRPKLEIFNDYLFISLKMLTTHPTTDSIEEEQISIILKDDIVFSFQERKGDIFDPIRLRLKEAIGRIRRKDADYLYHALLDIITDHYFLAIEFVTDKMERLEENIYKEQGEEQMEMLFFLKKSIMSMRRAMLPFKESLHQLMKSQTQLINKQSYSYFGDLLDHVSTVSDQTDVLRDMVSDLRDLYMSQINLRTNKVMQTLTIIATIFIPLTFLAGVYGMNFEHMPELGWKYSYPVIWVIFIGVAVLLLLLFRRNKWL